MDPSRPLENLLRIRRLTRTAPEFVPGISNAYMTPVRQTPDIASEAMGLFGDAPLATPYSLPPPRSRDATISPPRRIRSRDLSVDELIELDDETFDDYVLGRMPIDKRRRAPTSMPSGRVTGQLPRRVSIARANRFLDANRDPAHQGELARSRAYVAALNAATDNGQRGVRGATIDAINEQFPERAGMTSGVGSVTLGGGRWPGEEEELRRAMPKFVPNRELSKISTMISGLGAPFPMPAPAAEPEKRTLVIRSAPEPGRPYMQRTEAGIEGGPMTESTELVPYRENPNASVSNPADISLKVLRGQPLTDYEQQLADRRREYLAERAETERQRNEFLAANYNREPFDDLEFSRADLDLLRRRNSGLAAQVQGQAADRRARIGDRADLREYQRGQLGLGRDELRQRASEGEKDRASQERIAGMRDNTERLSGSAEQAITAKMMTDFQNGVYGDPNDPASWSKALADADRQRSMARGELPATPPPTPAPLPQKTPEVEATVNEASTIEKAVEQAKENVDPQTLISRLRQKFGNRAVDDFILKYDQERRVLWETRGRASNVSEDDLMRGLEKENATRRKIGLPPIPTQSVNTESYSPYEFMAG